MRDHARDCATKSGAEDSVEDYVGSENVGFDGFPGLFVRYGDDLTAKIAPALQVCSRVAPQFIRIGEQEYADGLYKSF